MDGVQIAYALIAALGAIFGLAYGFSIQERRQFTLTKCAITCSLLFVGVVWMSVNFPILG